MSTDEVTSGSNTPNAGDLAITLPPNAVEGLPKQESGEAASERAAEKEGRKASFKSNLRKNIAADPRPISAGDRAVTPRPQGDPLVRSGGSPSPSHVIPPGDMRAEEKEAFAKLSPEMQGYVSRRSYEMRTEFGEIAKRGAEREKEFSSLGNILSPDVRNEYARLNLSVPTVVENSIAWDRAFRTNPVKTASEYLSHWGVTLQDLYSIEMQQNGNGQYQAAQGQGAQYLTREQAEGLADERAQKALYDWQEQNRQAQTVDKIHSSVTNFMNSKPLFRDPGTAQYLETVMAPRVARLRALDDSISEMDALEEAYNYVVSKDPAFSHLRSQLAPPDPSRARQASRSISGGPGSGTPSKKHKSFREGVRAHLSA